jgi:hypothetical protein
MRTSKKRCRDWKRPGLRVVERGVSASRCWLRLACEYIKKKPRTGKMTIPIYSTASTIVIPIQLLSNFPDLKTGALTFYNYSFDTLRSFSLGILSRNTALKPAFAWEPWRVEIHCKYSCKSSIPGIWRRGQGGPTIFSDGSVRFVAAGLLNEYCEFLFFRLRCLRRVISSLGSLLLTISFAKLLLLICGLNPLHNIVMETSDLSYVDNSKNSVQIAMLFTCSLKHLPCFHFSYSVATVA